MTIYDDLGVPRLINAAAAQTLLGGSLMPAPVLSAMEEAATAFVSLPELHDRVGERLAELTRNDAACVSCGAAAGLLLAVAACMVGTDADRITRLPAIDDLDRTEVIVQRNQRNGFLSAVRETGAVLVETGATVNDLEAAITEKTAAVLWFAGTIFESESLDLPDVIASAQARQIPVIVDAADQIPPVANLWRYTRGLGADLAVFSGGKGLRGPQASGLIVGRRDLIAGCRANGGPYHSIGRPAKVGKEEMIGLLAAVEWAVNGNESEILDRYQATARYWVDGLTGLPGITPELSETSHSGQPIARAILRLEPTARYSRDAVIAALWDGSPRIAVLPHQDDAIGLNPQFLQPGEENLVLSRLQTLLAPERSLSGLEAVAG